ncbi:MAG TPA: HAMP domain-containing sensor histidine kinase [Thermoguttaceae bacterium]|nr:HAMP domain-containing sensor histidine kinase [Thermoguttaceae bacterium]
MITRRFPITLGVVMIVLLVVLIVGWVLVFVFGAITNDRSAAFYWTAMSVGTVFYVLLIVGVSLYLGLSVKSINLNRRQSNFIHSVTHELKSPITSMKLYLQTLNRHQVSAEQADDFHRAMLEDVERLDHLIDQVLEAGRLETQPKKVPLEEVRLDEVLRDCAETTCLRYRVDPQTIRLDVSPCTVRAARVDLDMIFRNLMDNAIKYAGNPPRIEVRLERLDDGRSKVSVEDNGRGIPPNMRRKVFGRFVRLGLELHRDRPGTGLGLYIVWTLVRRMKGKICISDPREGPGTVFEVELPVAQTEVA